MHPPGRAGARLKPGTGERARRRSRLVLLVLRFVRLVRRHGHRLGGDLALDDPHLDLWLVGPWVGATVDKDRRALGQLATEDEVRKRVLDQALDRAEQRPGAHRRVVALLDEELLRLLRELDRCAVHRHLIAQPLHLDVDDAEDLVLLELVEDDDLVDPVQELRAEHLLQLTHHARLHVVVRQALLVADGEPE